MISMQFGNFHENLIVSEHISWIYALDFIAQKTSLSLSFSAPKSPLRQAHKSVCVSRIKTWIQQMIIFMDPMKWESWQMDAEDVMSCTGQLQS